MQAHRRERLTKLAVEVGGYAALGRMLGYRDGAYVSQMSKGLRNISDAFVSQCEALHGFSGWFHSHDQGNDLFTPELLQTLRRMTPDDRKRMENLLRGALNMTLLR